MMFGWNALDPAALKVVFAFVRLEQVIHDNDIAGLEFGNEHLAEIGPMLSFESRKN